MLRRYLITNGVSTIALYAVAWTFVNSFASTLGTVSGAWHAYATEHTVLGPVLNRIVVVAAGIAGFN